MEAMLRGIPVVASDSGGLEEAKRGTGYVIPVRTIERYEPVFDEHGMPRPVLPENDVGPWVAALRELLTDRGAYERESAASRAAAGRFVSGLDAGEMERFLAAAAGAAGGPSGDHRIALAREAALLLERLRKRVDAHPAGAELALLSGPRRGRQIQPAADGGAGGARARLPGGGAHPAFGGRSSTTWPNWRARRAQRRDGRVVASSARGGSAHGGQRQPARHFAAQVEAFEPEIILASTDDPAQMLLEAALRAPTRPRGLPGARHAGPAVRPRLRLSERGEDRANPRRRWGGGGEPVRGRLHPQTRGHRRGARADFAAGARGLARVGAVRQPVRHAW